MIRILRNIVLSHSPAAMPGALRRIQDTHSVCLTFDDGPHPQATREALEALAKHHIRATFFLVGEHAERYGALARDIVERGHAIGNHGERHVRYTGAAHTVRDALRNSQERIYSVTGVRPVHFRPPYGAWLPHHNRLLAEQGLQLVLWSLMPGDFLAHTGPDDVYRLLRRTLRGGDIVVLHDNAKTAGRIAGIVAAAAGAIEDRGMKIAMLPV